MVHRVRLLLAKSKAAEQTSYPLRTLLHCKFHLRPDRIRSPPLYFKESNFYRSYVAYESTGITQSPSKFDYDRKNWRNDLLLLSDLGVSTRWIRRAKVYRASPFLRREYLGVWSMLVPHHYHQSILFKMKTR
jgi:hypothetical protein